MLPETVREAAKRFGDRTAYIDPEGQPASYADLDRISDEVAAGLAAAGVRAGDVVALVLPPGLDYAHAYLAIAKLGAITAGVNDRLSVRERDAVWERTDPALVMGMPGGASDAFRSREIEGSGALRRAGGVPPPLPADPDRDVAILFTSGT